MAVPKVPPFWIELQLWKKSEKFSRLHFPLQKNISEHRIIPPIHANSIKVSTFPATTFLYVLSINQTTRIAAPTPTAVQPVQLNPN